MVEPQVYMVFNEAHKSTQFATMYLNVIKLQGEMQTNHYNMFAMGLDLSIAQLQDKVELMEET